MMYSQARYQQEDYYEDQGGYRQPRGGYNAQYFDPYGYGRCRNWKQPFPRTYGVSQEQYQPRRPPPRTYDDKPYDEDYDYLPQRGSTNSQSYESYPFQAYSPQSYTQNTPPPKKKSIVKHMPRDPNDLYKTIEEHMFEHMNLEVICHACKGPHYRYQCQKYPYCKRCKAKFSCECRYNHHRDDRVGQRCNAKSQGKYGLSEETWALARRLGINIVSDDSMEDDIRVTSRVDQDVHNCRKQVSFKVPLEEVIEDIRESELEILVSEKLQGQEKENQNRGYRNEFEERMDDEVEVLLEDEEPHGDTFEPSYGKTLDSSCGVTTLGNNGAKSWGYMCDEEIAWDDIGVPICFDNSNINYMGACIENIVIDESCEIVNDDKDAELDILEEREFEKGVEDNKASVDNIEEDMEENVSIEKASGKINEEEMGSEENDDNEITREESEEEKLEEDIGDKEENVENKNVLFEEIHCQIVKEENESEEEGGEEKIRDENFEVEMKEEREKEEENKKREYESIFFEVDQCQTFEENMLVLSFREFVNARHLRAYLEERVDGAKGLVLIQVSMDGRL